APLPADPDQPIRELVGALPIRASDDDALRETPEILDQDDAERDRDRPQLADAKWLDALVGAPEPAQDLGIEPAVGVGHERPRQSEDARVAGKVPVGQLRELAVEPGGEMV